LQKIDEEMTCKFWLLAHTVQPAQYSLQKPQVADNSAIFKFSRKSVGPYMKSINIGLEYNTIQYALLEYGSQTLD